MQYAGLIGQVTRARVPLSQREATHSAVLLASCRSRNGNKAMIVLLVKCGAPHGALQKETSVKMSGYGRDASSYSTPTLDTSSTSTPHLILEAQLRSSGRLPCTTNRSADCPCLNSVLDQILVNIIVTAVISTAHGRTQHLQIQGVDTTVLVAGSPMQKRTLPCFRSA
jgi:hypothetical protein